MGEKKFEGFLFPNTTSVPDILFDELLGKLTGNELKVLLYIIRRTYGFGKNADTISLNQFKKGITTQEGKKLDNGCGIEHNRTILVALTSLEAKGYIISVKRKTTLGDDDTTLYRLCLKSSDSAEGVVTPSNDPSLPQVTTVVTPHHDGSYSTSRRVVTPSNPQETVLQETVLQERDVTPAHATHTPDTVAVPPPLHCNTFSLSALSLEDLQAEIARRQAPQETFPIVSATDNTLIAEIEQADTPDVSGTSVLPDVCVDVATGKSEKLLEVEPTPTHTTPRKPRVSKPKTPTQDEMQQARIKKVYACFESLFQELFEDPDYRVAPATPRSETHKGILNLIEANASEERLRFAVMNMWNDRDKQTGEYWWRDPQRLTIKAVCNQYAARSINFKKTGTSSPSQPNKPIHEMSMAGSSQHTPEKLHIAIIRNERKKGSR